MTQSPKVQARFFVFVLLSKLISCSHFENRFDFADFLGVSRTTCRAEASISLHNVCQVQNGYCYETGLRSDCLMFRTRRPRASCRCLHTTAASNAKWLWSCQYTVCMYNVHTSQWWASYFHKVTELLYFRYWWKKLATFNPLPTFYCNGSVTVTSYWFLSVTKALLITTKCN